MFIPCVLILDETINDTSSRTICAGGLHQFKHTFVLTSPRAHSDSQSEGSAVSHGVMLTFMPWYASITSPDCSTQVSVDGGRHIHHNVVVCAHTHTHYPLLCLWFLLHILYVERTKTQSDPPVFDWKLNYACESKKVCVCVSVCLSVCLQIFCWLTYGHP